MTVPTDSHNGSSTIPEIDGSRQGIGPFPENEQDKTSQNVNRASAIVIGLHLAPAGHKSVAYAELLKSLTKNKIRPRIISGEGLGAVVAALYAYKESPEYIDWVFFNFLSRSKGLKLYSSEWRDVLRETVLTLFKDIRIQDLKVPLLIPIWDRVTGKVVVLDSGLVTVALEANMASGRVDGRRQPSFDRHPMQAITLKQRGSDIALVADALGASVDFQRPDDYLVGLYGRTSTLQQNSRTGWDQVIDLSSANYPLDVTIEAPNFTASIRNQVLEASIQIGTLIEERRGTSHR
jgi:hypothetical protein